MLAIDRTLTRTRVRALLGSLALAVLVGCGGSSTNSQSSGVQPGTTCVSDGARANAADGCNTCFCEGGRWACTEMACAIEPPGSGGGGDPGDPAQPCKPGDERDAGDGCNTCVCSDEGSWACTRAACPECDEGETRNEDCNVCVCNGGFWACSGEPCPTDPGEVCPPPKAPSDQVCPAVEVVARHPDSGLCCSYGDPCRAPDGWEQFNTMDECGGGTNGCVEGTTRLADDGCNTCTCSRGSWACTERACAPDGRACGGFAGQTCGPNEYCAYVEGQMCGAADASATCEPRPQACDLIYAPVCGCDGVSYGNDCEAAAAGTGVLSSGECSK